MCARFFILLLLLIAGYRDANASHYRGGEINFRSLGNGTYEITFRIYSDCNNGDAIAITQDLPIYYAVFNSVTGTRILVDSTSNGAYQPMVRNMLPGCYNDTNRYCASYAVVKRNVSLPQNQDGYKVVNQRCCLGAALSNIIDPVSYGLTLECTIPGAGKIGAGSRDFGPQFNTLPPLRMCINSSFNIDYGATDLDGDSLAYRLVSGLVGGFANNAKPSPSSTTFTPLPYAPGFSYTQPLGSNGTMTLNAATGALTGRCAKGGEYLVCVACDEYRGGVLIGTVTRAYVIEFADCHKDIEAQVLRDSTAVLAGIDSISIVRCGSARSVSFQNTSIGATTFHWDFGVAGTDNDTSSLRNPQYIYPAAGVYPLTLIAYSPGCSDTLHSTVLLSDDVLNPDFTITGNICLLDTVLLEDNSTASGGAITQYQWRWGGGTASGNPASLILPTPGLLTITHSIISEHGCLAALNKVIDVRQVPIRSSIGDTIVPISSRLLLIASGGVSYNWEAIAPALLNNYLPGSATAEPRTIVKGRDFVYIVTGRDAQGCAGQDTVRITVSDQPYVFVPTAFSPNGDGRNDILRAYASGGNILQFSVYNRLGNLVFSTTSPHDGWDGRHKEKEAAMATYYWMLKLQSESPENQVIYSGEVVLVR